MKKMLKYTSLSAIAFVGAVSFSACSSSDDVTVENNPNYNPETNKVKTEFVINVTQPGERTRMTADDAGAGTFQGLNNMKLFCLTGAPVTTDNDISGSTKKINLTSYTTGPSLSGETTNNSSKVYTLYIPVGTTNFLFYATALASISAENKFAKGSLLNNIASATTVATATPAETDIKFNLESIVPSTSSSTVTDPQGYLKTILNGIKDAATTGENAKQWKNISSETGAQWTALKKAFNQFTNQATGSDVRQGSSDAVLSMVSDLFGAVNDVYNAESDVIVKALAKAVLDKIAEYFTVATSTTSPYYSWSGTYKTGTDGATFNSNKYPESQKLPTGSAVITYDNTNGFTFVNNGAMGTAAVSTAYDNFTYPSQLTYYCNSLLRQTTTSKNNTTDWPTTSLNWADDNNEKWSGWTTGAVTAATRAVAMKDNITYGAAQLYSTIKLGDGVGNNTTKPFVDNAAVVTSNEVANNSFDGSTDDKTITLFVHGLLIGGQPDAAQYEYLPQGTGVSKVIYDKFSADGTAVTTSGVSNYTLALDNLIAPTTSVPNPTQATVNIALEMTANKDFYGASGKIKAGQKFYLIGSLDPANGGSITWTNHTSFKSTDTGYNVSRVFIRDAKTVATFTLGENCLKSAYSTIPDLRSTQMLFGISVDLAWKAGLTFDVNIGE